MSGPEFNPRDDEQDEEEMFVLAITEMVQAHEISKAKLHVRSYVDYVSGSQLTTLRAGIAKLVEKWRKLAALSSFRSTNVLTMNADELAALLNEAEKGTKDGSNA